MFSRRGRVDKLIWISWIGGRQCCLGEGGVYDVAKFLCPTQVTVQVECLGQETPEQFVDQTLCEHESSFKLPGLLFVWLFEQYIYIAWSIHQGGQNREGQLLSPCWRLMWQPSQILSLLFRWQWQINTKRRTSKGKEKHKYKDKYKY